MRDGLVISDIASRGAIAKIGFHEGDRIVSVNGHRIAREADFIQYLFGDGTALVPVEVVISRDGRDETIQVDPSVLMADYGDAEQINSLEQFGIVADDRYPDRTVVWRVAPRSPAYYAGFRQGDVITTFQDQPVTSLQAFEQTLTARMQAKPLCRCGVVTGHAICRSMFRDSTNGANVIQPCGRISNSRIRMNQRRHKPRTNRVHPGADQQNDRTNRDSNQDNGGRGLLRSSR